MIQNDDEEETEVMEIIPDLEDLQEENMIQQVANPSQKFNKDIATYRFDKLNELILLVCIYNLLFIYIILYLELFLPEKTATMFKFK